MKLRKGLNIVENLIASEKRIPQGELKYLYTICAGEEKWIVRKENSSGRN
ncbi:MAG: hypothetical protein ACE5OR_09515 [bacterium]